MPTKHLQVYTALVADVLASNQVRYDFSRRRSFCNSLWDALWEEHNDSNGCGGTISDRIESEVDYRVKQAGPKGEDREWFRELCKKNGFTVDSQEAKDAVEQWARDYVYEDYQSCYISKKKPLRSTYSVPVAMDYIEDVDDDLAVARELGFVKLTEKQDKRLNKFYEKDPLLYEVMWKYWTARALMGHVDSLRQDKDVNTEIEIGSDDCLICPNCHAVNSSKNCTQFSSDGYSKRVLVCEHCSDSSSLRVAESLLYQLLHGPSYCLKFVAEHAGIPDTWPRLPGESRPPEQKLLARIKPMPFPKLKEEVEDLGGLCTDLMIEGFSAELGIVNARIERQEYGYILSLLFSNNGLVIAGNTLDDRGAFDHVPTEKEVLYMEDMLDNFLPEEVKCPVNMF